MKEIKFCSSRYVDYQFRCLCTVYKCFDKFFCFWSKFRRLEFFFPSVYPSKAVCDEDGVEDLSINGLTAGFLRLLPFLQVPCIYWFPA